MTRKTRKRHGYTDAHFNSRDGMLTYVWGPPLWHFLHTMSFNYPLHPTAAQKRAHRRYIESLQGVLPCGKCRDNFKKNLQQHPLLERDLAGREAFSRWMYELHEVVNRMLGKPASQLTYEDVRERYEHFRARCRQPTKRCTRSKATAKERNKEKGCVEPVYGVKSKCVLNIVPLETKCETLTVDDRCKCKLL